MTDQPNPVARAEEARQFLADTLKEIASTKEATRDERMRAALAYAIVERDCDMDRVERIIKGAGDALPCDRKPHRWRYPSGDALRCADCPRAIPFEVLAREPWRRASIEVSVCRRSPKQAPAFVRGARPSDAHGVP